MIGETSLSFTIDHYINKEDPLFELAKKGLEELKENFERLTGFHLKLKKYDIFKKPDGKSEVVATYECYGIDNNDEYCDIEEKEDYDYDDDEYYDIEEYYE